MALDDLTDVSAPAGISAGACLIKQPDGSWGGAAPRVSLNALTDVAAPADTPIEHLLGTTGVGQWEPVPYSYLKQQIVGPLQAQIGDPQIVAAHTDLVGYIGELDDRVSAVEGTNATAAAAQHLFVDNYSTGFIRISAGAISASTTIDLALATTPGPGGAIYPALADIPGQSNAWADFNGSLGNMKTAQGAAVVGSAIKEWIRKAAILTVHKDNSDPGHPALIVDSIVIPVGAGSSLALGDLKNVDLAVNTAPLGSIMVTTGPGQWGAVDKTALLDRIVDHPVAGPDPTVVELVAAAAAFDPPMALDQDRAFYLRDTTGANPKMYVCVYKHATTRWWTLSMKQAT
jgi:hypothetical protein